jgi:hypothetical protein
MHKLSKEIGFRSWEWLFSEAGHGKGPADGIGAAIKRQGDRHVSLGGNIQKAEDMLSILSESDIHILKIVSLCPHVS